MAQQLGDDIARDDAEARRRAEQRRQAIGLCQATGGQAASSSSSHGNAPTIPAFTLDDCLERKMAEHAAKIGLSAEALG